jgi:autotransporter-associated beta strand protein
MVLMSGCVSRSRTPVRQGSARLPSRSNSPIYYFDITHDYPSGGGVVEFSETLFAELKRRFGERLISVRAATAALDIPRHAISYIERERRAAEALAAADPHATFFFPNFHSPIARTGAGPRPKIINVVHDVQSAFLPELFAPEERDWLQHAYADTRRNADEVVFISKTTQSQFIERFGAPSRHRVIYNPIRATPVAHAAGSERPFLLAVAHSDHHPHKNVAGLLRLFAALAERDAELELYVTGHGQEAFWRAAGAVPDLIRQRVHHLGHVPRAELDRLYGAARALVSLSRFEGFNMPAAEAASHGTPLVLSDLPVHRELFGAQACLVDPLAPDLARVARFLARCRRDVPWPHRATCAPAHAAAAYGRVIASHACHATRNRKRLEPQRSVLSRGLPLVPRMAPTLHAAMLAGTILSGTTAAALVFPKAAWADVTNLNNSAPLAGANGLDASPNDDGGPGGDGATVMGAGASSNTSQIKGGQGGQGGETDSEFIDPGMGGQGGIGVHFTGTGSDFTNGTAGTVSGGNGGQGGSGYSTFSSGAKGGDGGAGVSLSGGIVTNQGTISGGNAGGGAPDGAGGAGIIGANLAVINSGGIAGGVSNNGATRANAITFTGGVNSLTLLAGSTITGNVVAFSASDTLTLGGSASGSFDTSQIGTQYQGFGVFQKTGTGTWTLTGSTATVTNWQIDQGTLAILGNASGALGPATGTTTISGGTLDLGGTTQTLALLTLAGGTVRNGNLDAPITSAGGVLDGIGGIASLTTTAGTTTLLGAIGYTGATIVNGGVLDVEGTVSGTSAVTVNAGGVLIGAGTLDPLAVTIANGGTFAPGNGKPGSSMTIVGDLALQSGATYLVQLDPAAASFAKVTRSASLGGAAVNAVFANGSYVSKTYTILTATGGVSGSFGALVNTNLPSNFRSSLSYDANDAFLDLALNFTLPGGLNANQKAVGNALTGFFDTNDGIPLVYGALSSNGLTQASGEIGTGAQQATFDAMNLFTSLLTDPFTAHNGATGGAPGATGFADDEQASAYPARRRDAFAMLTKAQPPTFEQRWRVWGAGFGGAQSTDGNTGTGSDDTTSRIFGTAVGADYLISPRTVAGFALAGGGTSFSVAGGLGGGRSDLFQAGAYVRHVKGPAYVAAALAYGWQDVTTDRNVTIAGVDHLRAEFNANAWSGRLEGGYRLVAPWTAGIGITPYAAGQVTTFNLPAYAEQVISGANTFALAYGARSLTDTRSEFGLRTDKSFAVAGGILTLRGRLAWAHDFNPDRAIAATFQALPGASFVVSGAAEARDSALTTASAEMQWINGWSAAATFEGEFSNVTRSYAGKGVLRHAW